MTGPQVGTPGSKDLKPALPTRTRKLAALVVHKLSLKRVKLDRS